MNKLFGVVVAALFALQTSYAKKGGYVEECLTPYVPNAKYTPDIYFAPHHTKITYTCDDDYYLDGASIITCLPSDWDYEPPRCLPKKPLNQCPRQISQLANGIIDGRDTDFYNPGERVWYICDPDYVVVGAQDVTCLPDGNWDYPAPTCDPAIVFCPKRDPPTFGSQTPDIPKHPVETKVVYSCEYPYVLKGSDQAYCLPTGDWLYDVPTCEAPTCRELQAPNKGFFTPDLSEYPIEAEVTFHCFEHYVLKGSDTLVCEDNGQWSSKEPICVHVSCDPLTPPAYGSLYPVKTSYKLDDKITFSCDEHFTLSGASEVYCLDTGFWSDFVPECVAPRCNRPIFEYGTFAPKKNYYDINDYVYFTCDEHYILHGSESIHCLKTGWSDQIPTCVPKQCARPDFENGYLEEDKQYYDVNERVRFVCLDNYKLHGSDELECLNDGSWSAPIPTCKRIVCARPTFNGILTEDLKTYNVGVYVRFQCPTGYSLDGAKKLRCLDTGKWNGLFPTCVRVTCSRPPTLVGGNFREDKDSYNVEETVFFYCNPGYTRKGVESVTCQPDATWSDSFPTCMANMCQRPFVEYGILTENQDFYGVGEMVVITCENNFRLVGQSKLTCQEDGSFDYPVPTCERVQCAEPSIKYGYVDNSKPYYDVHEYVIFICNPGFYLVGLNRVKCGPDGYFIGDLPTCKPVKCNRPLFLNGFLTLDRETYSVNEDVIFTCNEGFIRIGAEILTCEVSGDWSGKFPLCKSVTCPEPEIENGSFGPEREKYLPGNKVTFTCNENHFLDGAEKIKCETSGQWTASFPLCIPYVCSAPQLDNGIFQPAKSSYSLNENVNFVCDPGFTLDGEKIITCGALGIWSADFPTCERNQCRKPSIDDGSVDPVQTRYDIGQMVEYDCNPGFELKGTDKSTCQEDGSFFPRPPTCRPVTCNRPVVSDGVSFSPSKNSYAVGEYVTFKCRRGTTLEGADQVRCTETGDWSDVFPTCEANKCPKPLLKYGSFTPEKTIYHVSDRVRFTCDGGRVLQGEESLHCRSDGTWSDEFPTCKLVICPFPTIEDGAFRPRQDRYVYLNVVTFRCNKNFRLVGEERTKCLISGKWSHPFPICEEIQCQPPVQNPNIESVTPDQTSYDVGAEVTFVCRDGFDLVGSETSVCQNDESWSPREPTCKKRTVCRKPPRPRYSSATPDQDFYEVDQTITYKCRPRFDLKGPKVITCLKNGRFDRRPPQCIPEAKKCPAPYKHRNLIITPYQKQYHAGDVITFTCDNGLGISGEKDSTCKTDGTWSNNVPSCVFVVSNSCKGKCHQRYDRRQPCSCGRLCKFFKAPHRAACCPDYHDEC